MRLRALELSDLDLLFALENDESLWACGTTRTPYSRVALKRYILQAAQSDLYAQRQLRLVAEIEDQGQGEAVALVDLFEFSPEHHRAEVGIVVLPQYRQQGYGAEALLLLEDYSRRHLSLHQLYAYVPTHNTASLRLFQRMSYAQQACLKDWAYHNGQYEEVQLLTHLL